MLWKKQDKQHAIKIPSKNISYFYISAFCVSFKKMHFFVYIYYQFLFKRIS